MAMPTSPLVWKIKKIAPSPTGRHRSWAHRAPASMADSSSCKSTAMRTILLSLPRSTLCTRCTCPRWTARQAWSSSCRAAAKIGIPTRWASRTCSLPSASRWKRTEERPSLLRAKSSEHGPHTCGMRYEPVGSPPPSQRDPHEEQQEKEQKQEIH